MIGCLKNVSVLSNLTLNLRDVLPKLCWKNGEQKKHHGVQKPPPVLNSDRTFDARKVKFIRCERRCCIKKTWRKTMETFGENVGKNMFQKKTTPYLMPQTRRDDWLMELAWTRRFLCWAFTFDCILFLLVWYSYFWSCLGILALFWLHNLWMARVLLCNLLCVCFAITLSLDYLTLPLPTHKSRNQHSMSRNCHNCCDSSSSCFPMLLSPISDYGWGIPLQSFEEGFFQNYFSVGMDASVALGVPGEELWIVFSNKIDGLFQSWKHLISMRGKPFWDIRDKIFWILNWPMWEEGEKKVSHWFVFSALKLRERERERDQVSQARAGCTGHFPPR